MTRIPQAPMSVMTVFPLTPSCGAIGKPVREGEREKPSQVPADPPKPAEKPEPVPA